MRAAHRRRLTLLVWLVIALGVFVVVRSRRVPPPHMRSAYHDDAVLALDALQKASQFRDSGDELFIPRKRDMVGDDAALQMVTRADSVVENRLSSQIESCDKAVRSYRETF